MEIKQTNKEEKKSEEIVFLTFTELYSKKQSGLLKLLESGKKVFLTGKNGRPIKLSLAELS